MIEIDLIKRCQQGDEDSFEQLYKIYATKAFRTAYLFVNKRDIAEDILQETFLECYRDINRLHKPESFETWFYRILVRISWRLAAKERKALHENLDDCAEFLKDDQNIFESIETDTKTGMIREIINCLKDPIRTTIILYYYNDISIKGIAKIMNCLQGTVKSRLFNGRKIISKEIENRQPDFSIDYLTVKGV